MLQLISPPVVVLHAIVLKQCPIYACKLPESKAVVVHLVLTSSYQIMDLNYIMSESFNCCHNQYVDMNTAGNNSYPYSLRLTGFSMTVGYFERESCLLISDGIVVMVKIVEDDQVVPSTLIMVVIMNTCLIVLRP